jgi:peptidoglycan hydrolase-like protein with peptidoglycan-binding domain
MSYYMLNGMSGPDGLGYYAGLGADPAFNPAAVYAAWMEQTTANANNAVKTIQAGLNTLGFGPLVVDGVWGSGSSRAFLAFAQKNGASTISSCPGSKPGVSPVVPGSCPTKDGIEKMAVLLAKGGQSQASMFLAGGLGLVAVVGLGLLAMGSKKKKSSSSRSHAV